MLLFKYSSVLMKLSDLIIFEFIGVREFSNLLIKKSDIGLILSI